MPRAGSPSVVWTQIPSRRKRFCGAGPIRSGGPTSLGGTAVGVAYDQSVCDVFHVARQPAAASWERSARVFDAATGQELARLTHDG